MSVSVEIQRILKTKDYYEILKIERTATDSEVATAYKKLAMKVHPDKCIGVDGAAEAFKKVGKVKEVLTNDNSRAAYDRYGEDGPQNQGMSASPFAQEDIIREMFMGGMGGGGMRFNMNGTHFTFHTMGGGNPFGGHHRHHHQQQQQQRQPQQGTNPLNILLLLMVFSSFILPFLLRLLSNPMPLIVFASLMMVTPPQYKSMVAMFLISFMLFG
eukprot:TRINITY_DN4142_c1_g1_i1.p1 TRINITY_DN4142_c1_g1~~TRINITY_DN4142_c1_g1_i1.p1  ORF type:complete len:214 (+),score=47.43 TRINITY_DN4142_c1_g1_i1:128-769(+)